MKVRYRPSFILALLGSLCIASSGCSRPEGTDSIGPSDSLSAAKASRAVEHKTTDVKAVDAKKDEPDWRQINGTEIFRRWFVIERNGTPVGSCAFMVRTFQRGLLTRTGLEYRVFASTVEERTEHAWFKGFSSEYTNGGAIAEWANGHEGKFGMNYRLQGAGSGRAEFKGNLFDVGHRNPRKIKLPDGYKLLQAFAKQLREASKGGSGQSFEWKRYIWREWEAKWDTYRYTYDGEETVSSLAGGSIAAHRFRVIPVGVLAPLEELWVDQQGYPVQRRIMLPGGATWRMRVADQEPVPPCGVLSWESVRSQYEAEAKAFLRSIGVWY